jgi:hypothetical protein
MHSKTSIYRLHTQPSRQTRMLYGPYRRDITAVSVRLQRSLIAAVPAWRQPLHRKVFAARCVQRIEVRVPFQRGSDAHVLPLLLCFVLYKVLRFHSLLPRVCRAMGMYDLWTNRVLEEAVRQC